MYLGENRRWVPMRLESFSTDDGDGRNSRFFFKLFRVYSNSLEKSKVGEFSWS